MLLANLALGSLMWFFVVTDYSLAGTVPDLLFGPVAGAIATASLFILFVLGALRRNRVAWIALLPSMIGGGLTVLIAVIAVIPPFTLAGLFFADEVLNEKIIQTEPSPAGWREAVVTFRGVGAYDSGNGRVIVNVRSNFFPLIEREVHYVGSSYADENSSEYVRWEGENSLRVVGEPSAATELIDLGWRP